MNSRTQTGQKLPCAPLASQMPTQTRLGISHAPRRSGSPAARGRPAGRAARPRRRRPVRRRRQVRGQRPELAARPGAVGRREALLELVGRQPPVAGRAAQRVGDLLALGVGGTDVLVAHAPKASPGPAGAGRAPELARRPRAPVRSDHDAADRRRAGRAPGDGAGRHVARARHRRVVRLGATTLRHRSRAAPAPAAPAPARAAAHGAGARRRRPRLARAPRPPRPAVAAAPGHRRPGRRPARRGTRAAARPRAVGGRGRGRRRAARRRRARAGRPRRPRRTTRAPPAPVRGARVRARARRPPRVLRGRHRALRRPGRRGRARPARPRAAAGVGLGPVARPRAHGPRAGRAGGGPAAPPRRHPGPLGTLLPLGLHRRHARLLHEPGADFARHVARLAPEVDVRLVQPGETVELGPDPG